MNMFKDKRVLITGGAGFIGSNLARRLVSDGATVTLVDSMIPEYGGNLANIKDIIDKVRLNVSDVRDEYSLRCLIVDQDYLFNLAGQTSHMDSMRDPFSDLDINSRAQLSILECCRKYNSNVKVVFASTRQIYGKPEYIPVDEQHLLRPVDVNGINKMAGEWYHILYNNVYGIRACALRLTNTYGPGMRIKDARQTFLGIWIRMLLENRAFEVWGGDQQRDFTYIDDAVSAFCAAACDDQCNGKAYNIGGNQILTLRETAESLIRANGGGSFVVKEYPPERKRIDIGDYVADDALFRGHAKWRPKVEVLEGFHRTLEYYRAHLPQYT